MKTRNLRALLYARSNRLREILEGQRSEQPLRRRTPDAPSKAIAAANPAEQSWHEYPTALVTSRQHWSC